MCQFLKPFILLFVKRSFLFCLEVKSQFNNPLWVLNVLETVYLGNTSLVVIGREPAVMSYPRSWQRVEERRQ